MNRLAFILLLFVFTQRGFSQTIYVDADATGSNDGSSWQNAFNDLSEAIEAAQSGQDIWVAAGVYYPTSQPNYPVGSADPRFNHFTLKNGVKIIGGFAGDETSADQRDLFANKTVLSGDIDRNDILTAEGYVAAHTNIVGRNSLKLFYFPTGSNIDTTAVLDGFVLSGAYADNDVFPYMGGAAMLCQGASPKVVNCDFFGNYAKVDGGAIWIENSSMIIENCSFSGNYAGDQSGAVHFNNTSASLKGCTFTNNTAKFGGAVYIIGGNKVSEIENCTFDGNYSLASGGGVTINNARVFISKTTFSNNRADTWGGGVIFYGKSDVDMLNCHVYSNKAKDWGGGVAARYNSQVRMTNCKVQGNVAETYAGAGISVSDTVSLFLYNSLITGNQCAGNSGDEYGAAIFSDKRSTVKAYNITVTGNESKHPTKPAALSVRDLSKIYGYNSIVAYNNGDQYIVDTGTIEFYNSMSSGIAGNGNTTENPLFVTDPATLAKPSTQGDFGLWGNSPVNNKGSNSYLAKDVYDLDNDGDKTEPIPYDLNGNQRVFAGVVDMGCYEQQFASASGNMLSLYDGQQVSMSPGLALDNTDFTIEMWLHPRADAADGGYKKICGSGEGVTSNRSPSLYIFQNDRIHYGYGNGTNWKAGDTEKALMVGQWNHIAMSFDYETETLSLYANGRLLEQMTGQGKPVSNSLRYLADNKDLRAYIDEFRVWKEERTLEQLTANMNKTLSGNEPNLALYYSFDQVTSGLVEDQAGINNGTMVGTPGIFNGDAILTPVIKGVEKIGIDNFTIKWNPVPNARDYYIDVATDPEFKNLVKFGESANGATAYTVSGLSRGTVYYYKVTVKTNIDESGSQYGHVATKLNPPGNAFAFNGSTYINASDVCKYDFTEATIETWVSTSLQQQMAIWAANTSEGYNNYILYTGADGHLLVSQSNATITKDLHFNNNVFLTAGWNHVAVTIAADKSVNLYVNGELRGSATGETAPFPYGSKLSLGQEFDGASTSDLFMGQMDEFRVWNKALSLAEIQANMNKTLAGNEDGLVTYYNFDLQTGNEVIDNANIFDGKVIGTPNWVKSTATLANFVAEASLPTTSGFTINWSAVPGSIDYTVDVATDAAFENQVVSSVSTSGATTYAATGLNAGTKYYFRVNASTGATSMVNYTGTLMEIPGNALLFDGKDDYLEANQIAELNFGDDATIECWGYLDPTETYGRFIAINSYNGGNRYLLSYEGANGYCLYDAKNDKLISSYHTRKGSWEHLAATLNAAGDVAFYLNGKLIGTTQNGNQPFIAGDLVSFGQEFDGSSKGDFLKGAIDEVRIWNDIRTQEEIVQNMHGKLAGNEEGLEVYYDFDQSEGQFVYEKVKGLDATIIGAPQWAPSGAIITPLVSTIDEITPSTATLSWYAVNGATDYRLELATDADFQNIVQSVSSTSNAITHQFTGLVEGTNYFVRVASMTNRWSGWSATEEISTLLVPPGNALAFNQAEDMVNLGQFMSANWSQITVEAWIKPDPTQPAGLWPRVIGGFSHADKSGFALGLQPGTGVYFESYDQENTQRYFNGSTDVKDGRWHHIAATYDGTAYRIYVDGKLDLENVLSGRQIKKATKDIGIGNAWDGSVFNNFIGCIDEVRIWNIARTTAEINEYAHKSLLGNEAGLVSYYNLDKAEGNAFRDEAGNNDGRMEGTVEWAGSKALITPFALPATNISENGFAANWTAIAGAANYYLRIATDPGMTQLVEGLDSVDVGNATTFDVTGLNEHSTYYYQAMCYTDRYSSWGGTSNKIVSLGGATGELAINLDGAGNYIDISAHIAKVAGKNTGAITGWFKGTQKGDILKLAGDADNYMRIYAGDLVGDMNDESIWFVVQRGGGNPELSMGVNEGHGAFLDNEWHHFAIVAGDGDNRILIDGIEREVRFYKNYGDKLTQEFSNITSPLSLVLGKDMSVVLDELAIYKNPLTNNEIIERAHRKLAGDEVGLVAYYNFDHSTAVDASGMGRDGVVVGSANYERANLLSIPFLNQPVSGVTVADISWKPVAGAGQYAVDVATDAFFKNKIVNNQSVSESAYHLNNLDKNAKYFYRVKAKADGEWSEWSASSSFFTLPGKTLVLDGVDDYVIADGISNYPSDEATIECWVKADSTTGKDAIWAHNKASDNTNQYVLVYNSKTAQLQIWTMAEGGGLLELPAIDDINLVGTWHHIAASIVKNGVSKVYIDGKKVYEFTHHLAPIVNGFQFSIGQEWDNTTSPSDFFKGEIDEFRVWNIALTESQIRANMNLSEPEGANEHYIAHYTFDEMHEGNIIKDLAKQNDATLVNGPALANSEGVINPITLEPTNIGLAGFTLNLNDIASAESFEVEIAYDKTFVPPLALHENIGKISAYNASGLCPGVNYFYRVRAVYGDMVSAWSSVDSVTTVNQDAAIQNFVASQGDYSQSLKLTWETVNSYLISEYEIKRRIAGTGQFELLARFDNIKNVSQYIDTLAQPGTYYEYTIQGLSYCYDNDTEVDTSNVGFNIPSLILSKEINDETQQAYIRLDWNYHPAFCKNVEIIRTNTDNGIVQTFQEVADSLLYQDGAVDLCTPYSYQLVAKTTAYGDVKSQSKVFVLEEDIFDAIDTLDASKGYSDSKITLNWVSHKQNIIDEYQISRRKYATGAGWQIVKIIDKGTTQAWIDEDAIAGEYFEYLIVGVGSCGESVLLTDSMTSVGFRQPEGMIGGQITYEGGNPVFDVKLTVNYAEADQIPGKSLYFDGSDSLEVITENAFDFSKGSALEMWIKPETLDTDFDLYRSTGMNVSYAASGELSVSSGDISISYNLKADPEVVWNAGSWNHIAVSADTSLSTLINGKRVASGAGTPILDFDSVTVAKGYAGYLEEFRLWNIAKTDSVIDRNKGLMLGRDEKNLVCNLRFDEGRGSYVFDHSRSDNEPNKSHAIIYGADWSDQVPSLATLSLGAKTDKTGNYQAKGIWFKGSGDSYTITPSFGVHEFDPATRSMLISENSLIHSNQSFTDISAFRVTGNVKYIGADFPVEGVMLAIDGQVCVDAEGSPVITGADGNFEIEVPIGEHFISVQKMNHVFSQGYFPPKKANGEVSYYLFNDPVSGIQFVDSTFMTVAGRMVGGTIEGDKPIGFGKSKNNIGVAEFTLEAVKGYPINGPDRTITVVTDSTTGEYEVKLYPELYQFVVDMTHKIGNSRYEFNSVDDRTMVNLADPLQESSVNDTLSVMKIVGQDTSYYDSVAVYKYHINRNWVYRSLPSIEVLSRNNNPYFYDSIAYIPDANKDTVAFTLINPDGSNRLDYPVFTKGGFYKTVINVFEEYVNEDNGTTDRVPVQDGKVTVINGCATYPAPVDYTIENGKVIYDFIGGFPNPAKDALNPELSYTKTLEVHSYTGVNGSMHSQWREGNPFRAYVFGGIPTGTNFVTQGPDQVDFILRDPPGSNSHAYFEQGFTVSKSSSHSFDNSASVNNSLQVDLGWEMTTFVGFGAGVINTTEQVANVEAGIGFESNYTGGHSSSQSTTFTQSYSTSDDPLYVGAMGDLFFGHSTNITYGISNCINLMPVGSGEEDNGSNVDGFTIGLNKGLNLGLKFGTQFIYTQNHIENYLIPDLEMFRDKLLAEGNADSARFYSQQADLWRKTLATNEYQKYRAIKLKNVFDENKNISFDAGAIYEESMETEVTETEFSSFEFSINESISSELGFEAFGMGSTWKMESEFSQSWTDDSENSETETKTVGFVLNDGDQGDYYSVDVLKCPFGNGPVFSVLGGQSACPYGSGTKVKYADYYGGPFTRWLAPDFNNDFQLDNPTMKIEVPVISAENAIVAGAPDNKPAMFTLKLSNQSEVNADNWFTLELDGSSNPYGAKLKMDGASIVNGVSVMIPGGTTLTKTLELEKGQDAVNDYENIKLVLHSQCQADPTDDVDDIADTLSITAKFVPTCTDVAIKNPSDNWLMNVAANDQMPVKIGGYDINHGSFERIAFQYKAASDASWNTVAMFFKDTTEYAAYPGEKYKINGAEAVNYTWNMSALQDKTYQIRATSLCIDGSFTESVAHTGILDGSRPQVFGAPSPADGILSPNDEIMIRFSETIEAGLVSAYDIDVQGVLNGSVLNHGTSVAFDGVNDYATTPDGINIGEMDYTIEFWMQKSVGSTGTVISQGTEGAAWFSIDFGAGTMTVATADHQNVAVNPLDDGSWHHYSVVYKHASQTLAIFGDDQLLLEEASKPVRSAGTFHIGKARLANADYFQGAIHDLRIWKKALPFNEVIAKMSVSLAGNEQGLAAYWPMDEGEGALLVEKVHSRNATLVAGWNLTPSSYAYSFDGSGKALSFETGSIPVVSDMDMTIEFWFKGPAQAATLFSNGNTTVEGGQPEKVININMTAAGQIEVETNNQKISTTSSFGDDSWHHLAFVINRRGYATLYIDGAKVANVPAAPMGSLQGAFAYIGARGYMDNTQVQRLDRHFAGSVDELRIWRLARTQDQIELYRNVRLKGDEIGLGAYYPFETYEEVMGVMQSASTLEDLSIDEFSQTGESHCGPLTVYGGESFTLLSPAIKRERPKSKVNFDYVINNDAIIITPSEELSRIEKCILEITVRNIQDVHGNAMASPATWTAYIQKNQVVWGEDVFAFEKRTDQPLSFSTRVINTSGTVESYTISNVPAWLTASTLGGTLQPDAYIEVKFTVSDGLNIGDYSEDIFVQGSSEYNERLSLNLRVYKEAPQWTVDETAYQNSMNIVAQLKIREMLSADRYDRIGVFAGDECRGVAEMEYQKNYDAYFLFLVVYGNVAGEELTYKVWDASEGKIYSDVVPVYSFEPNAFHGSIIQPVVFSAGSRENGIVALNKGWTWVSFNLTPDKSYVQDMMASLNLKNGDIIKYDDQFATFDATMNAWFGTLSAIEPGRGYRLRVAEGGSINYLGIALDPTVHQVDLQPGWNRIGFIPSQNMTVNEALSGFEPRVNDVIKSQYQFAMYDGYQWIGSMKYMEPGKGYMYKSGNAQTISFAYPNVSSQSGRIIALDEENTAPVKEVNAGQFEYAMSIVAQIDMDEVPQGYQLGAFINGELRGVQPVIHNGTYSNYSFITVYGNPLDQNKTVEFKLIGSGEASLTGNCLFNGNDVHGDTKAPLFLKPDHSFALNRDSGSRIEAYPNPFKSTVTLGIYLAEKCKPGIEVYDLVGNKVADLSQVELNQGYHEIEWNGNGSTPLNSGVYMIRMKIGDTVINTKVAKY